MGFVSIIIPVYNAEEYLDRCIQSIIAQRYRDWSLILIDDGSSDNSRKICEQYASIEPRISYLSQKNAGVSSARNRGLGLLRTEYFTFIDADDWISPDYLSKLLRAVVFKDSCDMVICNYKEHSHYHPKGLNIQNANHKERTIFVSNIVFSEDLFSGLNGVVWGKLFRTSIVEKNELRFNTSLSLYEDLIFVIEYLGFC